MYATINSQLHLKPENSDDMDYIEKLIDKATLPNPAYIENEKQGRSQFTRQKVNGKEKWVMTPKYLKFYKKNEGNYGETTYSFPRGFVDFQRNFPVQDATNVLKGVHQIEKHDFIGIPRDYQESAIKEMLKHDTGILCVPTGGGKTFMGLNIIAIRQQPSLIIVHNKELLNQWVDAATSLLNIEKKEIGILGDGKKKVGKRITIAIINTLVKMLTPDIKFHFGLMMVDECHRTPSKTFSDAVNYFPARYVYGLSATPFRRDKLDKLLEFYIGKVRYKINQVDLAGEGYIMTPEVRVIETDFEYEYEDDYSKMVSALTKDEERNWKIIEAITNNTFKIEEGTVLIVSDRKEHLEQIASHWQDNFAILTGSTKKKEREAIIEHLKNGDIKFLFSTIQLIGEGFDLPSIEKVFLLTPVKFAGRVIQTVGRALRTKDGKGTPVIYDFNDKKVDVLQGAFWNRIRTYKKIGATIMN